MEENALSGYLQRRSQKRDENIKKLWIVLLCLLALTSYIGFESYRVEWAAKRAIHKAFTNAATNNDEELLVASLVGEAHKIHFKNFYYSPSIGRGHGRAKASIQLPWVDEKGYCNAMFPAVTKLAREKGKEDLAARLYVAHALYAALIKEIEPPQKPLAPTSKSHSLLATSAPRYQEPTSTVTEPAKVSLRTLAEDLISYQVSAGLSKPGHPNRIARQGDMVNILFLNPPNEPAGCYVLGTARLKELEPTENENDYLASLEVDFNSAEGSQVFLKLKEDVEERKVCLVRTTARSLPEYASIYRKSYRNMGCECAKETEKVRVVSSTPAIDIGRVSEQNRPRLYDPRKSRL